MEIKNESGDKKYFTIIPNYILNHSTLWDRDVYIQMKRITGESGTCWTSQRTLAKQCGISINRLKKSLNYLVEHKWIKFIGKKEIGTKGGTQEVNEYIVVDLWNMNMEFYEDKGVSLKNTPEDKGVSRDDPKGYHENAKGVSPDDDKEEPFNNNQLKKIADKSAGNQTNSIFNIFYEFNPMTDFKNLTQRKAIEELIKKIGFDKLKGSVEYALSIQKEQFAPRVTTPLQLKNKFGDVIAYSQSIKNNKPKTIVL